MNKKKLCIGAMALALSVGSVVQTSANYTMSVAYATDSTQQVTKESLEALIKQEKENKPADLANASQSMIDAYNDAIKKAEEEVGTADQARLVELTNAITTTKANLGKAARETANPTPAPTLTVDENRTKLQAEVDKLKDLEITPRFTNASTAEQTEYRNAVKAAEKALKDNPTGTVPNAATLLTNIETAKKNLTGTAFSATSQREALSLTLRMANKLKTKIADNSTISNEDKDSLNTKISAADTALKNQASTSDILKEHNRILAEEIGKVIEKYNLRAEDVALTVDELKAVQTEHNQAYATAYQRLLALDAEINEFIKKDDYTKLDNTTAKNSLTTAKTNAVEVYEDSASTADQLNNAYNELYKAYNEVKTAIKPDNTETSRLKSEIIAKTQNDPADLTKANKLAQQTYNIAKANANSVAGNADAKVEDLRDALNNLKLAELGLTPVPVKVVDDTKTELQRLTAQLKALVDEKATVLNGNDYKNASETSQKAYTGSIKSAQLLLAKQDKAVEQLKEEIRLIETAKSGLKKTDIETQRENILAELNRLVKGKDEVEKTQSYLTADITKQNAYKKAIDEGQALLTKVAAKETVTNGELSTAVEKIKKALTDMGYVADVTYSKNLQTLIDEAPTFRQNEKFTKKVTSKSDYEKRLVKAYNDIITEADNYIKSGRSDKATIDNFVAQINALKMAIMDEMSETELNLRRLVWEEGEFENSEKFKAAKNSTNETVKMAADDYKSLIVSARILLNNKNRLDKDMEKLRGRIDSAKAVINNPTDEKVVSIYKLGSLIDNAAKVMQHADYLKEPQARRDALEKAAKKAQTINMNSSKADIDSAISDLEAALNVANFRKFLKAEDSNNLLDMPIKDLLELARNVVMHPDFKDASKNQVDALKEALDALNKAIVEENDQAQDEAKTRLVSTLLADTIRPITEKVLNNKIEAITEINKNNAILELAKLVQKDSEFKKLSQDNKNKLNKAIQNLEDAIKSGDQAKIDLAKNELNELLLSDVFKNITKKLNPDVDTTIKSDDPEYVKELKEVLELAKKVVAHPDYENVSDINKEILESNIISAEFALNKGDKNLIEYSTKRLKQALTDRELNAIVKKIKAQEDASKPKDYKAELEKIIANDATLKSSDKYKKAQSALRKAYDDALASSKKLLEKNNPSEKELEETYNLLSKAVDSLDGNQFAARLKALKDDFAANKFKITDANKRADIEKKLKALEDNENATMDDLLTIETELKNAQKAADNQKKVEVQTQPVNTGTTVTPVTTPTTTTTPVTTTSTVPATVNPGGIVRTGIRSLIGVVVLLALAVGAYFALSKKDKKNRTTTVNRDDEKKTRTFEGDSNENK